MKERFRKHRGEEAMVEEQGNGKRLLSVEETALYLGIAPRTIYNQIGPKAKKPFPIKPKHWGKRVLFDKNLLDKLIDSLD